MADTPLHLRDARYYTHDLHPAIPPGEKWASVTTVLGILDKSGGLVPWESKLVAEAFAEQARSMLDIALGGGLVAEEWIVNAAADRYVAQVKGPQALPLGASLL